MYCALRVFSVVKKQPQRPQGLHKGKLFFTNLTFSHQESVPDWRGYESRFGKYRTFDRPPSDDHRVDIGFRIEWKTSASVVLSGFLLYLPFSFTRDKVSFTRTKPPLPPRPKVRRIITAVAGTSTPRIWAFDRTCPVFRTGSGVFRERQKPV